MATQRWAERLRSAFQIAPVTGAVGPAAPALRALRVRALTLLPPIPDPGPGGYRAIRSPRRAARPTASFCRADALVEGDAREGPASLSARTSRGSRLTLCSRLAGSSGAQPSGVNQAVARVRGRDRRVPGRRRS